MMSPRRPSRRDFLRHCGAGAAALLTPATAAEPEKRPPISSDLIRRENEKPGTRDWMLTNTRVDLATQWRCPWIEGYCSHTSAAAGDTLRFHVSTNPASVFRLEIFRMGFYGGLGGRKVHEAGPLRGQVQMDPPIAERRVRDCAWETSYKLRIPDDWLSGVYLGKLTGAAEGIQSYVVFIVRDERKADFIFQCSDHTWQAYNRWPDHFALYDDGANAWYWGGGVAVSFNRPYGKYCQIFDAPLSTGSGEFLLWEFPIAYWLEQHGYNITYISNQDTHRNAAGLLRARGFLSVGHDEYWTIEMFQNVKGAISAGVNVAFLSGNAVCGRIAYGPDERGNPNRVFERVDFFGPRDTDGKFIAIHTLPHESPYANTLIGAHSTGTITGGADWTCTKPEHWLFDGAGMKQGDAIHGLVGWEWHGDPAKIDGLEIVASGPTQSAPGQPNGGTFTATIYPGPRKNFVFNASTIWWGDGLSEPPGYKRPSVYTSPQGPDRRVQQITQNLLARMMT
jgi:hypothetical protein